MNPAGTLLLSIEAKGQEQWQVAHAVFALYAVEQDDDEEDEDNESPTAQPPNYEFLVELRMGVALQRVPDLADVMRGSPSLQVRVLLTEGQQSLLPGTVWERMYDAEDDPDADLGSCYYFQHQDVVAVRIEVLERIENGRRLRITGQTVINNYLKGSPDATFEAVVDAVSGEPYFKMW